MLQNAYFLAKIGADTAENEQHFAEILPKTGNYPTGPRGRRRMDGLPRARGAADGRVPPRHGAAVRAAACGGAQSQPKR